MKRLTKFIKKIKKTLNNMEKIVSVVMFIIIMYKFFTWEEKLAKTMEEHRTKNIDKEY